MLPATRTLLHARAQNYLLQLREERLTGDSFDRATADALLAEKTLGDHSDALRSPNTTHISIVTEEGAAASVTMSNGYGSGITIPGTGIACNNSLGEPEMNPEGYLRGPRGRRLVSNMAPTVAWHDDGRCLAFGSPGASRITTSIAQTWTRYALERLSFEAAVAAPRLHLEPHHDGLRLQFEPGIDTSLAESEFSIRPFESTDMYFGALKLAALDENAEFHAVADERRHGAVEIVR